MLQHPALESPESAWSVSSERFDITLLKNYYQGGLASSRRGGQRPRGKFPTHRTRKSLNFLPQPVRLLGGNRQKICSEEASHVHIIAALLAILYGALTAFGGATQIRAGKIQPWSAAGMVLAGLGLIAAGGLLFWRLHTALYPLGAGLVLMHLLAINNGLRMHGRLTPSHHLIRLAISVLTFGLAWWSLA
jgi:hypothetical protein